MVIGGAFTTLIQSFVAAFVTPLIGLIGDPDAADELSFTINNSTFPYGKFLTALISFIIILIVVYFAVVMPLYNFMNRLMPTRTCPKCLSFDVPAAAAVCKVCGSDIPILLIEKSTSKTILSKFSGKEEEVEDPDEEIFHDLEEGSVEGSVRSMRSGKSSRSDRFTAMES